MRKSITVHFEKVGAQKKSWSDQVASCCDRDLIRSIKRNTALLSRDIDFAWDEEGMSADIYVGVVRKVGTLRVEGGARV